MEIKEQRNIDGNIVFKVDIYNSLKQYPKPQGELHFDHILTEKVVIKLRKLKGRCNYKELAQTYGVSASTIYDAINGRTWRHI